MCFVPFFPIDVCVFSLCDSCLSVEEKCILSDEKGPCCWSNVTRDLAGGKKAQKLDCISVRLQHKESRRTGICNLAKRAAQNQRCGVQWRPSSGNNHHRHLPFGACDGITRDDRVKTERRTRRLSLSKGHGRKQRTVEAEERSHRQSRIFDIVRCWLGPSTASSTSIFTGTLMLRSPW